MLPALRVVSVLYALSLLAQPVLAGMFLSGQDSAVDSHATNATVVVVLGLAVAVLAFLAWRRKLVGRPVFTVAASMLVAEGLQMMAGYQHLMWLHIPLGAVLFGALAQLMPQVMRAGREPREPRASRPTIVAEPVAAEAAE